jgi:hypothetical protein
MEKIMTLFNRRSQRTKLYQLPDWFHCSIIGTCLTLKELKQLGRAIKLSQLERLSDYDLHRIFVGIASEPSYGNRRIQKHLDKKYQYIIGQFIKVQEPHALASLWHDAQESGEVAGAYWALVTHPNISDNLLEKVYGEIHMLSHLSGASTRVDMQELSRLRERNRLLEKQMADSFAETQIRLKEKEAVIDTLNQRLSTAQSAETQLREIQKELEILEKEPVIAQLKKYQKELFTKLTHEQERTKQLNEQLEQWQLFTKQSKESYFHLEQKFAQVTQERDSLEASLGRFLNSTCPDSCTMEENCPNMDLNGRCILFVGGRTRLCSHFRNLVEQYNGHFIHHDGGQEDGTFKLGSTLSQADAVLCPLDCISHEAMDRIKSHCKHNTKKLVMMPRASLSAFVKGLNEVTI